MNNVNQTLYIPLYGKAYVSRKGIILHDPKAEEIWEAEAFPLKGKAKSKWLAYNMGMRSAVFDDWTRAKMQQLPDAVVLHIGCGMDSRVLRVGTQGHKWFDVDFPEVIGERARYYAETADYKMLAGDVRSGEWLREIPKAAHAIVVMEGVSMYLTAEERLAFIAGLCGHFTHAALLMDVYTTMAAKLTKYKNPINEVGVTEVYGVDDPMALQWGGLKFVAEHALTPQRYIDELKGFERLFFKKMFAGSFANKIYRLYEYQA